jgi:hypothetical protein
MKSKVYTVTLTIEIQDNAISPKALSSMVKMAVTKHMDEAGLGASVGVWGLAEAVPVPTPDDDPEPF